MQSPYDEPRRFWQSQAGGDYAISKKRRPSGTASVQDHYGLSHKLPHCLINQLRVCIAAWRKDNYPATSQSTRELLDYWASRDIEQPVFFGRLSKPLSGYWKPHLV